MGANQRILARVQHPLLGEGSVHAWRRGGRAVLATFPGRPLPLEVAVRELAFVDRMGSLDPAAAHRTKALRESNAVPGSIERAEALQVLEAMRLGVVPANSLQEYTIGRTDELALVTADLDAAKGDGAVRAFLGDYGVGKTHLLELIQQHALSRGFLTATVILDPLETSPAHPKRVYRAALRALRYPDRPYEDDVGLEPLLTKAASMPEVVRLFTGKGEPKTSKGRGNTSPQDAHVYLGPALAYAASLEQCGDARPPRGVPSDQIPAWVDASRELLLDWLEGHPTISNQMIDSELRKLRGGHPKIYSLLDYRPWARIYGYLLSGLGALAQAAGYSGLVVLIDEAEFYTLLSKENRGFAQFLFRAWTWAACGGGQHGDDLPFEDHTLARGGYGVQKKLPPRYPGAAGLYVLFAMTPHPEGVHALEQAVPANKITSLGPLGHAEYAELARRVCDFYASAFPDWALPQVLVEPLADILIGLLQTGFVSNPRHAMKFIIEFLDVVRYAPDKVGSVIRNLQEGLVF